MKNAEIYLELDMLLTNLCAEDRISETQHNQWRYLLAEMYAEVRD